MTSTIANARSRKRARISSREIVGKRSARSVSSALTTSDSFVFWLRSLGDDLSCAHFRRVSNRSLDARGRVLGCNCEVIFRSLVSPQRALILNTHDQLFLFYPMAADTWGLLGGPLRLLPLPKCHYQVWHSMLTPPLEAGQNYGVFKRSRASPLRDFTQRRG